MIYYIYAPSYTEKSAGVVALYLLCHHLNESSQKAFILPSGQFAGNPNLNAPIATSHISDWGCLQDSGLDYTVVYPDIVRGNPLSAPKVVRYLLAYPGAYGGDSSFPKEDKIWSYTTRIARLTTSPHNILCLPVVDEDIFKPGNELRSGSCFYSNKYDKIHGNKLLDITKDAKRLEGTRAAMIALLQSSSVCYVYENSTVVVEAQLCGCPVILVRSDYFNELHSEEDFGMAGVSWSDQDTATEGVSFARKDYDRVCDKFFNEQLPAFIKDTE